MDINEVKIQETMQDWFIYFDQNIADFKLRHKDDINLEDLKFEELKQSQGGKGADEER